MVPPADPIPPVAFDRVAAFVRLITHDVRNGLNAIDLQSSFLSEIAEDQEVRQELGKLREMVSHVTEAMQTLSSRFGELRPTLLDYPVAELVEGLRETVDRKFEAQAKRIVWEIFLEGEEIHLDYNLLTSALVEIVTNALYFREGDVPIHFSTRAENGSVFFEVRQLRSAPAGDPMHWGREPLVSGRRGGYGLGLFQVRRILAALGGTWDAHYDEGAGEMRVRLGFPITVPAKPLRPA